MSRAATILVGGEVTAPLKVLDEPLSFWGGFDSATGRIIDRHHPQFGDRLTGLAVHLPASRGSSSASSVLVEAVRAHTAPAALLLATPDQILLLGALVAYELYGRGPTVVLLETSHPIAERHPDPWPETRLTVTARGELQLHPSGARETQEE